MNGQAVDESRGSSEPVPGRCGRRVRTEEVRYCLLPGSGPDKTGPCRFHGGALPQVKAAQARRAQALAAQAAADRLGLLVDISPQQALIDEVRRAAGMVAYYGARVSEIEAGDRGDLIWGRTREKTGGDDFGTTIEAAPHAWLRLWNDERDRLARVAAAAIKAGVEERRIELAERQGQEIAGVIRRILAALDLTEAQRVLVGTVVPAELRALTTGGDR